MDHNVEFICPNCKGNLVKTGNLLKCIACEATFSNNDGFYSFVDKQLYWGEVPRDVMQKLLLISKERGVEHGLNAIVKNEYSELYNYILNKKRITPFIPLLNLDNNGTVLDIGSGYGTASLVLSEYFKKVYAVEAVKERAEFISLISAERNKNNITVVQADMHKLPFPENTCDLVMLIGVLEWAGLEKLHKNPRVVQSVFLRNLFSILKPGGYLFIGIENRLNFRYFMGEIDHSGLKYTSLIPRFLANLLFNICQNKRRYFVYESKGYRTYTYSFWGYKRLLRGCGFEDINIFGCYPAYYDPKFIFPFSQDFIQYSNIIENKNIKTKAFCTLMKSQILRKCLIPSVIIVARKGIKNVD